MTDAPSSADERGSDEPRPDSTRAERRGGVAIAAVIGITLVAAFVAGRNLWFYSDDWNIIAGYHRGRLLEPFNSHLSAVPVGLYQLLFHTVGLGSYTPYRILGLAAYGLLGWATWRFARPHVGWLGATIAAAAVLWNSGGVTNVMFPFLLNFSVPVAALAAVWWHLDRGTPRHDALASAWILAALATSGLGLMVTVAVGVELVWTAVERRHVDWRRWAVLAPGPVLWIGWYLAYGVDSPASGGVRPVLSYAFKMLLGGVESLAGGSVAVGTGLFVALVALAVVSMVRRTIDGRLAGALAAPVAFAVLTAVSRIGVVPHIPPDELRYQWTVGAFIVFAVVIMLGAFRRDEPDAWPRAATPIAAIATVAVVAGAVGLVSDVGDWNDAVGTAVPGVRANLFVAEAAAANGTLDRDRALPVSYVRVTAGAYTEAIADLGSPLGGFAPDRFGGTADARLAADTTFVTDLRIGIADLADGPRRQDCAERGGDPTTVAQGLRPGTAVLLHPDGSDAVDVRFSLFSTGVPIGSAVAAGSIVELPPLPSDLPAMSYRLEFSAPTVVSACG